MGIKKDSSHAKGLPNVLTPADNPPPPIPRPEHAIICRLAERYGTLSLDELSAHSSKEKLSSSSGWEDEEPSGGAQWDVLVEDKSEEAEESTEKLVKMRPWRMLRYLVWKTPPLRLLLVSDNLPDSEYIISCTHHNVETVHVNYKTWSLDDLVEQVHKAAKGRMFTTIGLFDHGGPGEFCLLKSVAGGSIDMGAFMGEGKEKEDVECFFKTLSSYVVKPDDVPPRKSRIYRIDILACSVAADHGMALVDYLEELTDTNFAASVDPTGHDTETGEFDYELETEEGLQVAADYFNVSKIIKWEHLAGLSKTIEKGTKEKPKMSMSILDAIVDTLENGTQEQIKRLSKMSSRGSGMLLAELASPKESWKWVPLEGVNAVASAGKKAHQASSFAIKGGVNGAVIAGKKASAAGVKARKVSQVGANALFGAGQAGINLMGAGYRGGSTALANIGLPAAVGASKSYRRHTSRESDVAEGSETPRTELLISTDEEVRSSSR
mmetsp:Transcript_36790/g.89560  ORF Transcript_36790/g.89560 Transcript_36790/m.89560 type:complete len:494 (+) Transcript_36790:142-1623(+)